MDRELDVLITKAELAISEVYVARVELRRLLQMAQERRREQGVDTQRPDPPNGRIEVSSG